MRKVVLRDFQCAHRIAVPLDHFMVSATPSQVHCATVRSLICAFVGVPRQQEGYSRPLLPRRHIPLVHLHGQYRSGTRQASACADELGIGQSKLKRTTPFYVPEFEYLKSVVPPEVTICQRSANLKGRTNVVFAGS